MKSIFAAIALLITPNLAVADGFKAFACMTNEGREIAVTAHDGFLSYTYGFLGNVELRLDSDFNPTKIRAWGGEPAMIIYEEAVFANVSHTYTVYKEYHLETHIWSAGVVVHNRGDMIAVIECVPEYINTAAFAFEDLLAGDYTLFW